MEEKKVLCVLGDRRRVVCFRSDVGNDVEKVKLAITECFSDVLQSNVLFFLQTESTEWGGLIDVTSGAVNDHSTIYISVENHSKDVVSYWFTCLEFFVSIGLAR